MSGLVYGWLRGLVQYAWGAAAAKFGFLSLIPEGMRGEVIDWIVITLLGGLALAAIRWLETRQGDGLWPRLARKIGSVLMLGLSGKQPVYAKPPEPGARPLLVGYDNGGSTRTLR